MKVPTKMVWVVFSLNALLSAGCVGVLPQQVTFDRTKNWVIGINEKIPCHGALEFTKFRGIMHITVEGPQLDSDSYTIYFKRGPEYPDDFYLTYGHDDHTGAKLVEARGTVKFLPDDYVEVELKIKASDGNWVSPPINGRRRIGLVLPEGRRH